MAGGARESRRLLSARGVHPAGRALVRSNAAAPGQLLSTRRRVWCIATIELQLPPAGQRSARLADLHLPAMAGRLIAVADRAARSAAIARLPGSAYLGELGRAE